jgi:hypothetical protein
MAKVQTSEVGAILAGLIYGPNISIPTRNLHISGCKECLSASVLRIGEFHICVCVFMRCLSLFPKQKLREEYAQSTTYESDSGYNVYVKLLIHPFIIHEELG